MPQTHSENRVWTTGTIQKYSSCDTSSLISCSSHMLAQSHKVKHIEECLEFHWLHRRTYSTAQEEAVSAAAYDTSMLLVQE